MTQLLRIHPEHPAPRLINQAAAFLRQGGLIAYPTDSGYALGCKMSDKNAQDRIRKLRQLDKQHNFTLVCRDLSELAAYAKVDNDVFRLLKAHTPGAYTFILKATPEVPRKIQHPKRKTIGIRVPNCQITLDLLEAFGEPIMSSSLILPDASQLSDGEEIHAHIGKQLDLVIDGGGRGLEPTTVIDCSEDSIDILRVGKGDPVPFQS